MLRIMILSTLILFSLNALMSQTTPRKNPMAPSPLPGVSSRMETPAFWQQKLQEPDRVLMSGDEIGQMNRLMASREPTLSLLEDLPRELDGKWLRDTIAGEFEKFSAQKLYDSQSIVVGQAFWRQVRTNLALESIPARVQARYGILTEFSSLRVLPLADNLNSSPGDIRFDQAQQSGYEVGTPHVIFHTSKDGKWIYAQNRSYRGWYPARVMAICNREAFLQFGSPEQAIVVTAARTPVYKDADGVVKSGTQLRMGTILPQVSQTGKLHGVYYPLRKPDGSLDTGISYLQKEDCHLGFLPFNQRNAIMQAFKLLGQPYGWGDMNGDWDCSSLVQSVYQCFGLYLPRNGGDQAASLQTSRAFSKENDKSREEAIIKNAVPGLSLLRMPGHIMIYIGAHEGKAFVLHDVYAYRRPLSGGGDETVEIYKTVVSDLHLGRGSQRGSWLQRLTALLDFK